MSQQPPPPDARSRGTGQHPQNQPEAPRSQHIPEQFRQDPYTGRFLTNEEAMYVADLAKEYPQQVSEAYEQNVPFSAVGLSVPANIGDRGQQVGPEAPLPEFAGEQAQQSPGPPQEQPPHQMGQQLPPGQGQQVTPQPPQQPPAAGPGEGSQRPPPPTTEEYGPLPQQPEPSEAGPPGGFQDQPPREMQPGSQSTQVTGEPQQAPPEQGQEMTPQPPQSTPESRQPEQQFTDEYGPDPLPQQSEPGPAQPQAGPQGQSQQPQGQQAGELLEPSPQQQPEPGGQIPVQRRERREQIDQPQESSGQPRGQTSQRRHYRTRRWQWQYDW